MVSVYMIFIHCICRENQAKFIQQRINNVEKHFSDLCQLFGAYSRKLARVRDTGDLLAKGILTYAESEASSTKSSLTGFAERLSSVQDYRQAMVRKPLHWRSLISDQWWLGAMVRAGAIPLTFHHPPSLPVADLFNPCGRYRRVHGVLWCLLIFFIKLHYINGLCFQMWPPVWLFGSYPVL